jgi:WD40 repeat protein
VSGAKDGTIRIWEAITGTELLALQVHDGPVTSVALSPDGTQVASSSEDGTARLWGISNAELYRRCRVAEALQERLTARITDWVRQGRDAVRAGLADSRGAWSEDESREARNIAIHQAWAGRKSP